MKRKYDALDARILAFIAKRQAQFAAIVADCESEAGIVTRMDRSAWRTIDSRLQALRKSGKIAHIGGMWKIVEMEK